jgi:hypothetical protein
LQETSVSQVVQRSRFPGGAGMIAHSPGVPKLDWKQCYRSSLTASLSSTTSIACRRDSRHIDRHASFAAPRPTATPAGSKSSPASCTSGDAAGRGGPAKYLAGTRNPEDRVLQRLCSVGGRNRPGRADDLAPPGCTATWRWLDRLHACGESAGAPGRR